MKECFIDMNENILKKSLQSIATEACKRWKIEEIAMLHRVGTLVPDELLYAIAVSTKTENMDLINALHYIIKRIEDDIRLWRKEL